MPDSPNIEIMLLPEAEDFILALPIKVQDKVYRVLRRVALGERNVEIFKKLSDSEDLWEFRILFQKVAYRLFAFWDTRTKTLIVATHGLIKKTDKTPSKEIARAKAIRTVYFKETAKTH